MNPVIPGDHSDAGLIRMGMITMEVDFTIRSETLGVPEEKGFTFWT